MRNEDWRGEEDKLQDYMMAHQKTINFTVTDMTNFKSSQVQGGFLVI
jgi:hypothetical protein